jgi:hypothetical protein
MLKTPPEITTDSADWSAVIVTVWESIVTSSSASGITPQLHVAALFQVPSAWSLQVRAETLGAAIKKTDIAQARPVKILCLTISAMRRWFLIGKL